ncbi:MAG: cation transporter [Oscillospiraceae bacterium]|nr:cation transporter [Oscillospiraceae bacterium]
MLIKKTLSLLIAAVAVTVAFAACAEDNKPINPIESGNNIIDNARAAADGEEAQGIITTVVSIKGMSCGKCVNSITAELNKIDGVFDVVVDLDEKNATVEHDSSVSEDDIKEGIMAAGYTPVD